MWELLDLGKPTVIPLLPRLLSTGSLHQADTQGLSWDHHGTRAPVQTYPMSRSRVSVVGVRAMPLPHIYSSRDQTECLHKTVGTRWHWLEAVCLTSEVLVCSLTACLSFPLEPFFECIDPSKNMGFISPLFLFLHLLHMQITDESLNYTSHYSEEHLSNCWTWAEQLVVNLLYNHCLQQEKPALQLC